MGLGQNDLTQIEIRGPKLADVTKKYAMHEDLERELRWMGPMMDVPEKAGMTMYVSEQARAGVCQKGRCSIRFRHSSGSVALAINSRSEMYCVNPFTNALPFTATPWHVVGHARTIPATANALIGLTALGLNLAVDLFLVIEVVGHRGMCFCVFEVGMLSAHFVRGPAVRQIIGCNLCHSDSGQTLEPRRLTANFSMCGYVISSDIGVPGNLFSIQIFFRPQRARRVGEKDSLAMWADLP